MSTEAMTAVWEHGKGTPGQRNTLLALANRADEHGVCWPGIPELVKKTKMTRRGVQYALRALEKSGQLTRLEGSEGGRGITPLYWIKLPTLDGDVKGANRRRKGANGRAEQRSKGADDGEKGRNREPERAKRGSPEPLKEPTHEQTTTPPGPLTGHPATAPVVTVLSAVAQAKEDTRPPTTEAVARAIADFPDRDHLAVAGDLEFWAIHGKGRRRRSMALAQTFRNFLKTADPVAHGSTRPGGPEHPADRRVRELREMSAQWAKEDGDGEVAA